MIPMPPSARLSNESWVLHPGSTDEMPWERREIAMSESSTAQRVHEG